METTLPSTRIVLLCVLLGVLALGWFGWRKYSSLRHPAESPSAAITKQPVNFTTRTFDPSNPPSDLPAMTPGENAECDSDFESNASVAGQTQPTDATHAILTITKVRMTLQLNITIWLPTGVTPHVVEHEEGHLQISEAYYRTADKVAARIAAGFLDRQVEITGNDLNAESNKALELMAHEITATYEKELNPEPAQLLYDSITDHSRNEVVAKDAVAHALKNVTIESARPENSDRRPAT